MGKSWGLRAACSLVVAFVGFWALNGHSEEAPEPAPWDAPWPIRLRSGLTIFLHNFLSFSLPVWVYCLVVFTGIVLLLWSWRAKYVHRFRDGKPRNGQMCQTGDGVSRYAACNLSGLRESRFGVQLNPPLDFEKYQARWDAQRTEGDVVVMVHGFSSTLEVYQYLWGAFEEIGIPCIAYDLYGRGWSVPPKPTQTSHTPDYYVKQLEDLLVNTDLCERKVMDELSTPATSSTTDTADESGELQPSAVMNEAPATVPDFYTDPFRFVGSAAKKKARLREGVRSSGRFHLIGFSMGGVVARLFAAKHPDLVRSLTLLAPAGMRLATPWFVRLLPKLPLLRNVLLKVAPVSMPTGLFRDWSRGHPVFGRAHMKQFARKAKEEKDYNGTYGSVSAEMVMDGPVEQWDVTDLWGFSYNPEVRVGPNVVSDPQTWKSTRPDGEMFDMVCAFFDERNRLLNQLRTVPNFMHSLLHTLMRFPLHGEDSVLHSLQEDGILQALQTKANSEEAVDRKLAKDHTFPIHVVWGKQDTVCPVDNVSAYSRLLPRARITLVDQAGHNVLCQRPREVVPPVLDFILRSSQM